MASESVKEVAIGNRPELAKPTPTSCGQHFGIRTKVAVGDRPIIPNLTAEIIQRPERFVQLLHLGGPGCLRNLFMETSLFQAFHCPVTQMITMSKQVEKKVHTSIPNTQFSFNQSF